MERKSDVVRKAVAEGDFKKALAIAKGFRLGISNEQVVLMTRAYECMVHPDFYRQLGVDVSQAITEGKAVVRQIYG